MVKFASYLNGSISYKRWELVKYALATLVTFLPGLMRFFHYFVIECLFTFVAFFCLVFGLMLLFRLNRKWFIPTMAIGIFGASYQLVIGKPVGYQILNAMYETNHREMLGFLSSPYSVPLLLGGTAVLVFVLWLIVGERPLPFLLKDTSIRRKYLFALMTVSLTLFSVTSWRVHQTYPVCLFYNNFMYVDEKFCLADYQRNVHALPKDETPRQPCDRTFILIIGESARRVSYSIYGYPQQTTPNLDALLQSRPENVVVFSDAITTSAFTRASVMSIYSPLTLPEELSGVHTKPGLSRIFRESGWHTLYITTRPRYSLPNMLSTFLDDAEKKIYLTTLTKKRYDEEAVPLIEDFIKSSRGDKLIVLHLMGSHIEYAAQYPSSFRHFKTGDKWIDAYNDSIRYSDHVIGRIVDLVMNDDKPGCVLYVSDHGENLNDAKDNNFGHGTKALTLLEFQVPFIFCANDEFLRTRRERVERLRAGRDAPVCHDHIVHTFMGLADLKEPGIYRNTFDISSNEFTPGMRFVADENMNIYDFATLDFGKKTGVHAIAKKLHDRYLSKFTW